jgi:hypothetical protein
LTSQPFACGCMQSLVNFGIGPFSCPLDDYRVTGL